jgi:methyl-accepting chemotaxis protein
MANSLKTKYLFLALGVGAGISVLFGGFAYYEHRVDSVDINRLAYTALGQELESDLQARAEALGRETGALLTPALASGNKAAIASFAARLLEQRDIERVDVMDADGAVLFTGRASPGAADQAPASALEPMIVKIVIQPPDGAAPGKRGGALQISVSRARMQATLAGIRAQLDSQQGNLIKRMRGMFAGVLMPLLALGLIGAWFIARQWAKPISALIKSAKRIGQGDYTRPLDVARRDELGDLQHAL